MASDRARHRDGLVEAYQANVLFKTHQVDPEFGSRLLANETRAAGEAMCDRMAWRIRRDNKWLSAFGAKRRKNEKRPGPPVHADLVKRDYAADDVHHLWLTDIAEHPTGEGKLYLCSMKDTFSGRTVGYSMDSRMKAHLAVNALERRHLIGSMG